MNRPRRAITSTSRHQNWTLDHAGNWDNVKHDFDGSGWDVDEDRDHNEANELIERDIAECMRDARR